MSVALLILGLVMFVGLVVVHEFGHFYAARKSGVDIEEFGIGFPPRAWSKKMRGGYIFSLNWLPVGGFVRLKGEHDADTGKGSFGAASLPKKTIIMLAGVVMNTLTAFILLTLLALVGLPKLVDNQFTVQANQKIVKQSVLVGAIESKSPAAQAGLKAQYQLISLTYGKTVNPITDSSKLPPLTKEYQGKQVGLKVENNGVIKTINVKLRTTAQALASQKKGGGGYLGVEPVDSTLYRYTWAAPVVAAGLIKQITILTFKGLGNAVAGLAVGNTSKASAQVSGPVGIVVLLKNASLLGYQFVITIVAIISLSLAIINVLPIPALDGGRLFFTLIPRIFLKRPIKQKTEELISGIGLGLIFLLFILVTLVDIKRIF